jgi:hypothetical protein
MDMKHFRSPGCDTALNPSYCCHFPQQIPFSIMLAALVACGAESRHVGGWEGCGVDRSSTRVKEGVCVCVSVICNSRPVLHFVIICVSVTDTWHVLLFAHVQFSC